MADIPNILLVFSDPLSDLNGINEELAAVTDILEYAKHKSKRSFDYHHHKNKSVMDVINRTAAFQGYTASFFHFSGHANEHALLFPGGQANIATLCSVLHAIKTRIVFLNGCCTHGFLEELFKVDSIIAAIVTYSKVGDKLAARLSKDFYISFIRENNTLYKSFVNIRNGYQDYVLHEKGFNMSKRDLTFPTQGFPDEQADKFQWGLFYKDDSYRNITIDSILTIGSSNLELKGNELDSKKKELQEAEKKLNRLTKFKDDEELKQDYEAQLIIVNDLKAEIQKLEMERVELLEKQLDEEKEANKRKLNEDFTNAIKNINYKRQREIYAQGNKCKFACYAVVGDENTLIDLLLLKMQEEYGFRRDNLFDPELSYHSNVSKDFWPALAWEVGENDTSSPEQITRALITKHFLFSNQSISQKHIFLKIKFNLVDLKNIPTLVYDFWTNVKKVCSAIPAFENPARIRHKIVVMLIHEGGTAEQLTELKNMTQTINEQLETKLDPIPWVEPLKQQEIENWIDNHALDRVGLNLAMAEEIYSESDNGKIKKVLESVKRKCDLKEHELFHTLKILPDDAQTLFGQKRG
ncbi:coiled-coil domain-containing protein [Longitalea luteola]|uniref:coiled-coil domain-containing protein n=1 Tax=Longitalea luteola TaxID=2812563 RepID=UPI001A96BCDE|nr:hypothetical protein [Longitalea luteola]